jgi:hypothetical protein
MEARARAIVEETHGLLLRKCFVDRLEDGDVWSMTISVDFRERGVRNVAFAVAHAGTDAKHTAIGDALTSCASQAAMWPWPILPDDQIAMRPRIVIATGTR